MLSIDCQQAQLMICLRNFSDTELLIQPCCVARLHWCSKFCATLPTGGPDDEVINLHFRRSLTAPVICGSLPQFQGLEHPGICKLKPDWMLS